MWFGSSRCFKYFVDTNLLIYANDTTAGVKPERAKALVEELWNNRSGVVSTQVLQGLCDVLCGCGTDCADVVHTTALQPVAEVALRRPWKL